MEIRSFNTRWADLARADRERALELGQKFYWDGKECKRGHNTWKRTDNGECYTCVRRRSSRYQNNLRFGSSTMLKCDHLRDDLALQRELDDPLYP